MHQQEHISRGPHRCRDLDHHLDAVATVGAHDLGAGVAQPLHGVLRRVSRHGEEAARPLVERHRRHDREIGVVARGPYGDLRLVGRDHRLDHHSIGAAFGEGADLLGKAVVHLRLAQRAEGLHEHAGRPDRADDEVVVPGLAAGVLGSQSVELPDAVPEAISLEAELAAAE